MSANSERLAQAITQFNEQSDDYFGLYANDIELHGFPPGVTGKEGARAFYHQIWTAFPDYALTIEDQVEQGDTIALRYMASGTHSAEFLGVPATGNRIVFEGQTFLRFGTGGEVVERWVSADTVPVLVQLGAMPAPT